MRFGNDEGMTDARTGSMIVGRLLVRAARRLGSRLTISAVAGLLIVVATVALPLVVLAQDATLSTLSLSSGTLRPTFAATTTEYRAAVQYNVSRVTVTVTATAATGVTVEYLDATDITLADADTGTNGHQVDLAVGETAFKVKVTSGAETETYTVTVERNSAYLFGWTPTRDINALEAAGNADPQGMWSDGTTMWVADDEDNKLYAYTLATGAYDATKDISLHSDNGSSKGIWSDATTIWVADDEDDKLYAYALSDGARQDGTGSTTDMEFSLHTDNGDPAGIWSDGTTIWVANSVTTGTNLFAYTLSDGSRDTGKEFELRKPSGKPFGIWSDGSYMWAVHEVGNNTGVGNRVYAYEMDLETDGTAGPNHGRWERRYQMPLRSAFESSPVGMWSDSTGTIWVVEPDGPRVNAHIMLPSSATSTTLSALTINDGTQNVGLRPAFDSTRTVYRTSVTDDVARVTVRATPSQSASMVAYLDRDNEALEDAGTAAGLQVAVRQGVTVIHILVTAQDGSALIHRVVVERDSALLGGWTPTKDIDELDPLALNWVRGIWSDGTTMWITNYASTSNAGIYAYKLTTSARDITQEFSLNADNANPRGIWSNGTTIWVVDDVDDKLYAYTLATGMRVSDKDIDLHADNGSPQGLWSDDTTIWVTDSSGSLGGVYAYTLSTGAHDTDQEFQVVDISSTPAIGGIWSDGTTIWVADTQKDALLAYVKATGARDAVRDIYITGRVAGPTRFSPGGVWGNETTVWVTDYPTRRLYSFRVPPSSPTAVALSDLVVSPSPQLMDFDANLRPEFSFITGIYRVAVSNRASRVTVSATPYSSAAARTYLDENGDALVDADPNTTGFQLDVAVGETSITIRLASGGAVLAYTVVVERDSAELYGWTPTRDVNTLTQDNPELAGDFIRGVWRDSTTLYVLPHSIPTAFAYTWPGLERVQSKDIPLDPDTQYFQANSLAGIWSDGTTMWVLNYGAGEDENGVTEWDGHGKIFAYKLSDGSRDAPKDFPLHLESNWAAGGIWSDGTTVWVSDWEADKLFAYTLATGARVEASDITLHHLNNSAQGIWSDGTTIWVTQWNSDRFFAYDLATGVYDPDNDFDRTPGNRYPRDVWSDGTTLYVSDDFGKLFAYNMTGPAMDAELSALTLSGITLSPQFASSIYTYTYSADAATTLAETKVMATTNNSNAVAVIKLNGVVDTDGTVDLKLGENIITVEVTATDGMTMKTYTVTVMVQGTVSFGRHQYYVSEGDEVEVTVELSHALPDNASITFPLTEIAGDALPDEYAVPDSITFGANKTSASFTVTATQDTLREDDEYFIIYIEPPTQGEDVVYGDHELTIINIVNDDSLMTITPRTLDVDEGSTATYTVKLNTVPTGNVDVEISSNDPGAATVSPEMLTFTPTDWSTAKTVTVMGVEDSDLDNESVRLSNDPSGADYDSVSTVYVALNVADNDRTGVHVSKTSLTVLEEDTAGNSYTVALSRQPTADVTVTVAGHAGTDVTPSPATLTFTSLNWATAQTVTVKAGNDADTATDMVTLTHRAMSADSAYNGITIASVAVTVTDNDRTTPPITGGGGGGFGAAFEAPQFVDGFRTSRPLEETARVGDAVGDPVAATHPRNSEITYSLSGTDAARFTVDEETGQIRLGQAIPLELGQTYTVNLTATDSSGTGAIIIVDIEVAEAPYHRYDLNKNGSIEKDEVLAAVADYFAARIEKPLVLEVVSLYFAA